MGSYPYNPNKAMAAYVADMILPPIGGAAIGLIAVSLAFTGHPYKAHEMSTSILWDRDCNNPSKTELASIRDRLDSGSSDSFGTMTEAYTPPKVFARKQAGKYKLSLVNDEPYQKELDAAEDVDAIEAAVDGYVRHFDMKFSIKESQGLLDKKGNAPIDKEDIDKEGFREGARKMIGNFSYMPVEIGKLSGVSRIQLSKSIAGTKYAQDVIGSYHSLRSNVLIEADSFYDSSASTATHELTHGIDENTCGFRATERDPGFHDINSKEYGTEKLSMSGEVASSYGATNAPEDKATIGEDILTALNPETMYSGGEAMKDKIALLLGRINNKVPGAAGYIIAINEYFLPYGGTEQAANGADVWNLEYPAEESWLQSYEPQHDGVQMHASESKSK